MQRLLREETTRAIAVAPEPPRPPTVLLVALPALVAALGLVLVLGGVVALRESARAVARERLGETTRQLARALDDAFRPTEALITRIGELAARQGSAPSLEVLAPALVDLAAHRPGVSFASLSYPDGTFVGAYLDEDGTWRVQESRVGAASTEARHYDLDGGTLRLRRAEHTDYDPRERPFYRRALAGDRWTEPYPFFATGRTGITRVLPVRDGETLVAVATVDFDVDALTAHLRAHPVEGGHALLVAEGGTVLAHTEPGSEASERAAAEGRVLRVADLGVPALDRYLASEPVGGGALRELDVDGATFLVAEAALDPSLGLPWRFAAMAPEEHFLATTRRYGLQASAVGWVALLVAVLVAYLLARYAVRARTVVAQAREAARVANDIVDQLGSYRLLDRLGAGGMGEVWRAEHTLLSRRAAVKLIRPPGGEQSISADARERFRREAEALARLDSRNTVELYDFGVSADGRFFLVTELLHGMDLDTLLERHGPVPVGRAISILRQACRSLAEAHDAGLVHRDIKPANLFVCRQADELDVVKVLDFGVVRLGEPATEPAPEAETPPLASTITGTPAFMAPEQARGQVVDGRADLYALACVGVWLLTGRLVFERATPMALLVAHMAEPVPDLTSMLGPLGVPPALVELLVACLAKERNERPASAREVLARLASLDVAALGWGDAEAAAWWDAHRAGTLPVRTARPEPDADTVRV